MERRWRWKAPNIRSGTKLRRSSRRTRISRCCRRTLFFPIRMRSVSFPIRSFPPPPTVLFPRPLRVLHVHSTSTNQPDEAPHMHLVWQLLGAGSLLSQRLVGPTPHAASPPISQLRGWSVRMMGVTKCLVDLVI